MLRAFRDRWEIPIANIQRALDRGVLLMDKTINYIEDVQRLTSKASRLVERLDVLIDKEEVLKTLEAERIEIEIEILRLRRDAEETKLEKSKQRRGNRKE